MFFLFQMKLQGKDIKEWMESIPGNDVDIPGVGSFPIDEIIYYYRKLQFLEQNGFFSEIPQEEMISKEMTAERINVSLSNLRQVTFELTDSCQMDCYYCGYGRFYSHYDKRENKFMDFPTIKRTLDYINGLVNSPLDISHKRDFFVGFYGGEPLLNFSIIKETVNYVKGLKWLHNNMRFTVTTNGLLLDKYIDFMMEHDFNIFISLDGDESSNAYRVLKNGKPSYRYVLKNAEMLQKKYPGFFQKRVFFNAVLHSKNSVEGIVDFFSNYFNKKPSILTLNTGGIREDKVDEFWRTYVNQRQSLYHSEDYSRIEQEMFIKLGSVQAVTTFLFNSVDFYYADYNNFYYSEKIGIRYPTDTCLPFSRKLFLTVNGKILACERIGQEFELGWVTKEGVQLDYQEIADRYNQWFSLMRNQCRTCYIYDQCIQCIFYLDLKGGKPVCKNYMDITKYSRYVSSFLDYFEHKPQQFERILKEVIID
ncbi:MAG: radical SAM peptide maturase [Candidatus Aminicenantes bacterium]|nr:radical SAM peptide maturase [Candidatus Aminicenantes bacterium]NIO85512.1 radical SAM peptide maturase [Candidatus Aminicenantes bacterium]